MAKVTSLVMDAVVFLNIKHKYCTVLLIKLMTAYIRLHFWIAYNKPKLHYTLWYALALCFGSNWNPSGTGPSNISEILIQSAQFFDIIIVSKSLLPHWKSETYIYWVKTRAFWVSSYNK